MEYGICFITGLLYACGNEEFFHQVLEYAIIIIYAGYNYKEQPLGTMP